MTMQMWMLPGWLRAGWVVVFGAVVALHLHHAYNMAGQRRYWHVGHVLMGAGMAYMYLPHSLHLLPDSAGTAGFAAAGLVAVSAAGWFRRRDGTFNPLWGLAVVEMAVMSYMFLPMSTRPALLSYGLAIYLAGQGVLWVLGVWDRFLAHRGFATPAATRALRSGAAGRAGQASPTLRSSLVAMAAGMAYMLVVR